MLLSVIIPTYNVEAWIEKCLLSILNQNLDPSSYELLVVNDESTDNSAAIARRLAHIYPQIKVIDQKNRGLSGARNAGIRNARGKYVLFIDSDDYIEPNTLKDMLAFAENGDLEIAMFGQNIIIDGIKKPRDQNEIAQTPLMSGMELFFKRASDSACKYLIRTDYIINNDLFFFEKAVYLEDGEWSPRVFVKAKRTAYKAIYFYNYLIRENSLVTSGVSVSEKALIGYMNSANNLLKFQKEQDLSDVEKYFINQTIAKFVFLPITLSATKNGIKQFPYIASVIKRQNFGKLDERGVVGMRLQHLKLYNKSIYHLYVHLLFKNTFSFLKQK